MPETFLTGKCEERGWRRYLWRLLAAAADGVCRASRREKGNAMTRTPVLHKLTGQEEWRRDVADPTGGAPSAWLLRLVSPISWRRGLVFLC